MTTVTARRTPRAARAVGAGAGAAAAGNTAGAPTRAQQVVRESVANQRRYENGQLATTERWTAILTIVIQPPRDAERLRANPLGIYVNAINWSREMSQ